MQAFASLLHLSRFENGRQTPSRTIGSMLFYNALALPDDRYYALVTPEELEIEALKKGNRGLQCAESTLMKALIKSVSLKKL